MNDLAADLTLDTVDKQRIINILSNLGALNYDLFILEALPDDVLLVILSQLDLESISLLCKTSIKLGRLCKSGKIDRILQVKQLEYDRSRSKYLEYDRSRSKYLGTMRSERFVIIEDVKQSQNRGSICNTFTNLNSSVLCEK